MSKVGQASLHCALQGDAFNFQGITSKVGDLQYSRAKNTPFKDFLGQGVLVAGGARFCIENSWGMKQVVESLGCSMMNVHVQEVSIVDGVGREVELICHDEMSGDTSLETGCLMVARVARVGLEAAAAAR